ncbi:MAG TPA: hypothetical protein VF596_12990 [Pyrinomonadaceae bacterium]|jgi:hypothetical protein
MKIHVLFLLMLLLTSSIYCQATASATSAAPEMKKMDFLVGQWQGEGWMMFGPSDRRTFRQTETVQSKVAGTVLVIEGLGKGKIANKGEEVTIHSAFAVISFDKDANVYRWRAFKADGTSFDVVPQVMENSIVWGFKDVRAGDIRFTIKLNEKGQWVEIGEISRDSKTWNKFFEMILNRVS